MGGEDRNYLSWIRLRVCAVGGDCRGPVCAHHKTGAGMSLKAHDRETIPLCHGHHMALHGLHGKFKGWDKARLRKWQEDQVAFWQGMHDSKENF